MITFLLLNILLFVPRLIQISSEPTLLVNTLLAYPTVLVAGVLFGALGCAIAKNKWHFAFPRGGILISLLLNSIGVVFPMVGRWYLDDPQSTKVCRRAMGVQATIEWAGLLLIFCLGGFLLKDNPYVFQCASLVANLLVFRLIPFSPFGSFGGARVWNWNKAAFAGIAAVTLAIILIVVFL